MIEQVPTTYLGLFIALMMGMWGLIALMIRATLTNQTRLSSVLENHLGSIEKGLALCIEKVDALHGVIRDHDQQERGMWKELADHERLLWKALLDRVAPAHADN